MASARKTTKIMLDGFRQENQRLLGGFQLRGGGGTLGRVLFLHVLCQNHMIHAAKNIDSSIDGYSANLDVILL